jgi:hypothetical protein
MAKMSVDWPNYRHKILNIILTSIVTQRALDRWDSPRQKGVILCSNISHPAHLRVTQVVAIKCATART